MDCSLALTPTHIHPHGNQVQWRNDLVTRTSLLSRFLKQKPILGTWDCRSQHKELVVEEWEGLGELLFSPCWTPVSPQASPNCNDDPWPVSVVILAFGVPAWSDSHVLPREAFHSGSPTSPVPSKGQSLWGWMWATQHTSPTPDTETGSTLVIFLHLHYSGKLSLRLRFSTQVPCYFSLSQKKNLYSSFNWAHFWWKTILELGLHVSQEFTG